MINKAHMKELIGHLFGEDKNISPEGKIKRLFNVVTEFILEIISNPTFSQFEYGLLSAYLTVWAALSSEVISFEDVCTDLEAIVDTYVAIAGKKEIPARGKELLEYYSIFVKKDYERV